MACDPLKCFDVNQADTRRDAEAVLNELDADSSKKALYLGLAHLDVVQNVRGRSTHEIHPLAGNDRPR